MTFGPPAGLARLSTPASRETFRMANGGLTVPQTSFQEYEPCS